MSIKLNNVFNKIYNGVVYVSLGYLVGMSAIHAIKTPGFLNTLPLVWFLLSLIQYHYRFKIRFKYFFFYIVEGKENGLFGRGVIESKKPIDSLYDLMHFEAKINAEIKEKVKIFNYRFIGIAIRRDK